MIPRVKSTTPLNNSLARAEKGPKLHMEELRPPEGPQGEASSSRARNRWKPETPSVAELGAGGAA
eukprot:8452116-Alexandrium_andersonii.AAC.1